MSLAVNSLPNDKILDWSKLEAFAEDKINVTKKLKFAWGGQKTWWKKEKMLVTSIFSFSHDVCQEQLYQGHQKLDCAVKG